MVVEYARIARGKNRLGLGLVLDQLDWTKVAIPQTKNSNPP